MSTVQNVNISKWHLGFGALSGTIYYFTNANNRQNFQNYMYHTFSNIVSEWGHINVLILLIICSISFTRCNFNIAANLMPFNSLWSRSVINLLFFSLRVISAIKIFIALIRSLIKLRKFTKFQIRSQTRSKMLPKNVLKDSVQILDNKCIICLDSLTLLPNNECTGVVSAFNKSTHFSLDNTNHCVLECDHIFHSECFKLWYTRSEQCPYCRSKVD